MGLDQYLRAKTKSVKQKSSRGACDGLFPIAPANKGTTEIGYWRKAYDVSDYLDKSLKFTTISISKTKKFLTTKSLRLSTMPTKNLKETNSTANTKKPIGKTSFRHLQRQNGF